MFILLIGWAVELVILDINGTLSDQNLFWTLWQERALGPEVLGGYTSDIIRDCAFVGILGVALCARVLCSSGDGGRRELTAKTCVIV
jgi:hypothetical protein